MGEEEVISRDCFAFQVRNDERKIQIDILLRIGYHIVKLGLRYD